ncbi:MAG TPA: 5-formyltetrahydrofolate cyclo-ligase [Hellea balneolensis]|uniref:5-formyltetrahydrofolate cyclo-ligase n=1 Tax=Hellea balneolensis TaxID=287478 RepID=A0A7C3C3X8_9PROT|nr:5-formyltetrahydrofolate cyclo-ligase [Hellea balneolensis]
MSFNALHKTRARNAATMIRQGLCDAAPDAGVELIRHWPQLAGAAQDVLGTKPRIIAAYMPLRSEIDPRPLMQALTESGAGAGYDLALPCIKRKHHPLVFRRYEFGDKLKGGAYGTREPQSGAALCVPDIVLLPLLAFSRDGERLGYGGGYYDRTLAELRASQKIFACGLAYSGQEVPTLTSGEHDQKLDGVLSEKYFRKF